MLNIKSNVLGVFFSLRGADIGRAACCPSWPSWAAVAALPPCPPPRLSNELFTGLRARDCIRSLVVIRVLSVNLSLNGLELPLTLLAPEAALRCDTLLAESSGTTSLEEGGRSLVTVRAAGPLRLNDAEGTRSCCAVERALIPPDIEEKSPVLSYSAVLASSSQPSQSNGIFIGRFLHRADP